MSINIRRYKLLSDFEKVSDLLRDNYGKYEMNGNICQSRWEYAHTHPCFNHKLTHRFGVWEEINEIVGIAFYEMDLGDAFLCTKKGYEYLKNEMIDYAMTELSAKKEDKNIKQCLYLLLIFSVIPKYTPQDLYTQLHTPLYRHQKGLLYHLSA